jgi:SAM-dependent methyltransferase
LRTAYAQIRIAGEDTAEPRNLAKRIAWIAGAAPLRGRRVLDCGCGAGGYVAALASQGAEVTGVEHDEIKVARFRRAHPELAARVRAGDLARLDEPAGSFDVALLNEVLEHVPDEAAVLREIRRVLAPGGRLIVFAPNRLYPFETHGVIWKRSGARLAPALPFVPWLPLALGARFFEYPARNYWPRELRAKIAAAGFELASHGTVWQTFENISGRQPALVRRLRPALRALAALGERTPVLRAFGVSQVVVALPR